VTAHVDEYRQQSRWSDPGSHAVKLRALPREPAAVGRCVSGLVSHCLTAQLTGVAVPALAVRDVEARSAQGILERILARDKRPLSVARDPAARFYGVCSHFALLATAALRMHGTPARMRCGFAAYFLPGSLEDHWVCEYWDGRAWRLLDAQLDEASRRMLGITFSPADVPRDAFVDAGTAWGRLRAGDIEPSRIGITAVGLAGEWFVAQSVLRDAAALNCAETLPWDTWSVGRQFGPHAPEVPAETAEHIDGLAHALRGSPDAGEATRVYREREWVRMTPTIFSLEFPTGWPNGVPAEVTL
jgi:hypothetical protein